MGSVNTFYYIQNSVQNGTEHIPDVAHNSTRELISNTEDTSAYDHRVNVANVNFSWEKQEHLWGKNWFINNQTRQALFKYSLTWINQIISFIYTGN